MNSPLIPVWTVNHKVVIEWRIAVPWSPRLKKKKKNQNKQTKNKIKKKTKNKNPKTTNWKKNITPKQEISPKIARSSLV